MQVVEQKGLDIVRRDWCALSKDVGNYVLGHILSGQAREEVVDAVHLHLQEVLHCCKHVLQGSTAECMRQDYRSAELSVPMLVTGLWHGPACLQ